MIEGESMRYCFDVLKGFIVFNVFEFFVLIKNFEIKCLIYGKDLDFKNY